LRPVLALPTRQTWWPVWHELPKVKIQSKLPKNPAPMLVTGWLILLDIIGRNKMWLPLAFAYAALQKSICYPHPCFPLLAKALAPVRNGASFAQLSSSGSQVIWNTVPGSRIAPNCFPREVLWLKGIIFSSLSREF